MKMLVNRKPVEGPWGGGNNFIKGLVKHAPDHGFTPVHEFHDDIDLIFMIDPRYSDLKISINEIAAYKKWRPQTKVVYRINECDQRKGLTDDIDPVINASSKVTDMCLFISNWILDYHVKDSWDCDKNHVIYSGTNTDHFKEREKIDNSKVNIVTHHWSDNPLKGQDIYQLLDNWLSDNEDYTFSYIGRTKGEFKNSIIVPPTFGEDLGKKLSSYDVYVSASRWDPGPNHIIESLACNLPTYAHSESGGGVELVGESHVYDNFNQLIKILEDKKFEKNQGIEPTNWSQCIDRYFQHILKLF